MSEYVDKLQTAKGRIALQAGFFTALGSKMEWIRDDNFPAPAGTNGQRTYYNGAQVNEWDFGDVVFLVLHEIMHPMLGHLVRCPPEWDKMVANIAMDIVGNSILRKMTAEIPMLKMTVPKSACLPEDFGVPEGITFEETYRLLMKDAKKVKMLVGNGSGKGVMDDHMAPEGKDGKPMTAAEKEAHDKEWQVSVQAAATMAKQMGKLPGFLEEFVSGLLTPKVDWRAQLAECISSIAKDESSWRRFNRRHISRGLYLPGTYSERIGHIAYFCDTSGSISSNEFQAALGAMTDIIEDLRPEKISFGQCDTELHRVDELTLSDFPLPGLTVMGRGGTDMNPAFAWACAHEHEIDAFILQTDGYVPPLLAENIPQVPVVVIVTSEAALPDGWDFRRVVRVQV